MGLDTMVYRSKAEPETILDTNRDDVNHNSWQDCLYWRKCWGVDRHLSEMVSRELDDYVGVIDFYSLVDWYNTLAIKADKIVNAVNKYKDVPYGNIEDIHELASYEIAWDEDDLLFHLNNTIESIIGEEFTDSIWGGLHNFERTLTILKEVIDAPEAEEYNYVWVSSF